MMLGEPCAVQEMWRLCRNGQVYFGLINVYQTYLQPTTSTDMEGAKIDSSVRPIRRFEACDLVLTDVSDQ
jgi:hypothetical protein